MKWHQSDRKAVIHSLHEIIKHLENELRHVRSIKNECISSSDSSESDASINRTLQIKQRCKSLFVAIDNMQLQTKNDDALIEKIKNSIQMISDTTSENELLKLIQQIKSLLHDSENLCDQESNNRIYTKTKRLKNIQTAESETSSESPLESPKSKLLQNQNGIENLKKSLKCEENQEAVPLIIRKKQIQRQPKLRKSECVSRDTEDKY